MSNSVHKADDIVGFEGLKDRAGFIAGRLSVLEQSKVLINERPFV